MTSIAQIVSEIIDALSDGISNLVLLIVQLKEQNAQMPEGVPREAKKTIQNAVQLSQVGMLLAEKDYAGFPDIAKEITDASKDTIEATALLSNSIDAMSDSDRKKGWEGILQSCSVMAEKTIRLLQIVYGAELKKLLSLNDSLNKITKDLNPDDASRNPEDFANSATDAGQKAIQIARLLDALSKSDQFPWLKEKLAQLSNDLIKDAQNLVDQANELLEDPDDPLKRKLFDDAKNRLLKSLADMLKSLNESPLSDSAISNSFVPINTEALKAIRPNQTALDKAINDIKDLLDKLINAAKNGDKELYDNLLAQLSDKLKEAKELALKQGTALSEDPERLEPLMDLINEISNTIPPYIDEAKKLNDEKDFSKLFDATQRLKDLTNKLLDRISNVVRPNGILENIKKIEDELDKIKANMNEGKGNDAKRLEPINNQLNDDILNLCNMIHDNNRRNDLLEALDRMNRAFKKLCDCKTPEEFDKAMKEYLDALQHLSNVADAPRLDTLQKLKADALLLETLEDPESIQKTSSRLVDLGNKLFDLSENRPNKETEELQDLEKSLKKALESAIEVLNNPESATAKGELEESSVPLLKTAFALEKKIIDPQNNYYGTLQTTGSVNDIDDSIRKLLETLLKLKGIVPNLGTDKDGEAKKELEKLIPNIQKLAVRSNNHVTDNKNDLAIASLEETKRYNGKLIEEIKKGDNARIIEQSKALSNNMIQTIGLLEQLDVTGDKKEQLNGLSDELKSKLAEALRKLKEVVANENSNSEPVKEFLNDINNTMNRIKNVIYNPSHDEKNMRDHSDEIKNKLKVIKANAKQGNKEGVESHLQKLDNDINKFTRATRKRRIYNLNNNNKDDPTLKEFLELASKIGHLARELAQNPNDKNAEESYATIESAIQHKMNALKEKESVNEISCLQDIEDAILSVQDGLRENDALIINKAAKEVVSKMNYLSEVLNNHADPQKKDQLEQSFRDLGNNIKELLRNASQYHKEGNEEVKEKADHIVSDSKVKIAKMIGVLTKSRDKKSTPEHIRIAQQNPTDEDSVLKALESTYILATKENDLHKRDRMEQSVIDVSQKQEEYKKSPTVSNKKELENSLENLYHEVMNDCIDNELESYADVIYNTSNIKLQGENQNIIEDCVQLKDSLENHIKATMEVSRQKKGIYANVHDKESKKSINELGKDIKSINVEAKKRKEPVEEPKTFEDVLEHVANNIQEAIGDSSQASDAAEIVSGSGIVYELRRLADAARKGNAAEMLLAAKAVANHLREIIQEIKDVVNRMGKRNPIEQEKLLKSSVALNNYGTQMKILTSVKASSIKENTDNDETLLSITRSLGAMLTDSIKTIDTVKIAVLKEKS